jgi:cell division protein FtsQ
MKKWLKISLLSMLALMVLVLWVLGRNMEQARPMNTPKLLVHVDGADALLNETELYNRILSEHWFVPNQRSESLDVRKIEHEIRQMEEVNNVRVFKMLGGNWKIEVWLRKPIARIFAKNGKSYYLDSDGVTISKSQLHTANLLLFSGEINEPLFRQDAIKIINNDSLKNIRKLDEIYRISNYVCNDPMLRALIGQVYLERGGEFVLTPLVGDFKIRFGTAYSEEQVKDKFTRLKIFYKEGLPYEGWDKYSEINLMYDGQIVCRNRNKVE